MILVAKFLLAVRRRRLYARLDAFTLPSKGVTAGGFAAYVDPRD
jgi:hypothetical protein